MTSPYPREIQYSQQPIDREVSSSASVLQFQFFTFTYILILCILYNPLVPTSLVLSHVTVTRFGAQAQAQAQARVFEYE